MKTLSIGYPDSVDIASIPKSTPDITVSDGTNTLSGGRVIAVTDLEDPEPVLVPHTHPVSAVGSTGAATP